MVTGPKRFRLVCGQSSRDNAFGGCNGRQMELCMSVTLEKRANGVAIVTINRPEVMNALDVPAKERLGEIWRELTSDDTVRAIILTGAGERAFCAGSDIKEINRTGRMVTTDVLLNAIPGVGVVLDKP